MIVKLRKVTALFVALTLSATAAAFPIGSLEWVQPTGTVTPTESIPVSFRLRLTDDSMPLIIGAQSSGAPMSGLDAADLEELDIRFPDYRITNTYLNHFFECGGTFTSSCLEAPPYRFEFSTAFPNYDVEFLPGVAYELAHGTFIPEPGPVPAGTYQHFNSGIYFVVEGFYNNRRYDPALDPTHPDYEPETLPFSRRYDIASIGCVGECGCSGPGCTFERTVKQSVPAPGPLTLLLGALALVAVQRAHRR